MKQQSKISGQQTGETTTESSAMSSMVGMGNEFIQHLLGADQESESDAKSEPGLARGSGHEHDHGHGGTARDGNRPHTPATKSGALAYHKRGTQMVDRIVKSGLSVEVDASAGFNSRPNLLRNSAEWIDQGLAEVFVLSPTHDSHLRAHVRSTETAYFDPRVNYKSAGATYDDSAAAQNAVSEGPDVQVNASGILGGMSGNGKKLTIVDPVAQGEGLTTETIIHEVQHDADQHKSGDPWATTAPAAHPGAVDSAPDVRYNSYQSEFRAYWMENPEGSSADGFGDSSDTAVTNFTVAVVDQGADGVTGGGDDIARSVSTNFQNVRQQTIFQQLFNQRADNLYWDWTLDGGSGNWTVTYGFVPYYYAMDPNFKAMIDSYANPVAGNAINSVRLQALSEALQSGRMPEVRATTYALDELDRSYLSDRSQSQPVWDQARSSLSRANFKEFEQAVTEHAPVCEQESVEVQSGDTLGLLAGRYLDDSSRWQEIYAINKDVIGPDPNILLAGQRLTLPTM